MKTICHVNRHVMNFEIGNFQNKYGFLFLFFFTFEKTFFK